MIILFLLLAADASPADVARGAKSTDPAVRYMTAAVASRAQKVDGYVAALAPLTTDRDPETRTTTLIALRKQGAAPISFLPLLNDADWRVRVEALRGALGEDAPPAVVGEAAALLTRDWLTFDPKRSGDAHPLLVGLDAFTAHAKLGSVRAMYETIYIQAARAEDIDQKRAHCFCALGRLRAAAGTLSELYTCADPDTGARLAASALEEGLGGADKQAVLMKLWKHPSERFRAMAAAAAVSARLSGTVVEQALAAKEPAIVAFVADALATYKKEQKKPALSAAWIQKAKKRLSDPSLDVDAKIALAELVDDPAAKAAASMPASAPVLPFDAASARDKEIVLRVRTNRGNFSLRLDGKTAPVAVASMLHLSKAHVFDGTIFHRVVADFVVQGGDPTGTGAGSAGYTLPAEPSKQPFWRGAVGIADSGPGTGGSQWFVMHSRAPHLEGRYTWIGRVSEGQDVIDRLQVGDRIESISY